MTTHLSRHLPRGHALHAFRARLRRLTVAAASLALGAGLLATAPLRAATDSFEVLHSFEHLGGEPMAALVADAGGWLYGTTYFGGAGQSGTVFRLRPDGGGLSILHAFSEYLPGSTVPDGHFPRGAVLVGHDGALYGTTDQGGLHHAGTVFRIGRDGSGYNVLHTFGGTTGNGARPFAGLTQGPDGTLYGTTYGGGPQGLGTVYSIQPYGTGFTLLHTFTGTAADGANPVASLTLGADGWLYGATGRGAGPTSPGTLFKMRRDGGEFALIHTFTGADGSHSRARLLEHPNGGLYGVAYGGGAFGYGTLFRLGPDGSDFEVLHHFGGPPELGGYAGGELALGGPEGELYGTVEQGGTTGRGTVFRIEADGTGYTVLREFVGGDGDGRLPVGGLLRLADGTLCGTTRFGGPLLNGGGLGTGTVFCVGSDGSSPRTLAFLSERASEGAGPMDRLVAGPDGAFYGVAPGGGDFGAGTLFRFVPALGDPGAGSFAVLHHFGAAADDGREPKDAPLLGADGMLYGVTRTGGAAGYGAVYRVKTDGADYEVLHSFAGGAEGWLPFGSLVQGTDGLLHGVTNVGGAGGQGVVYRLAPDGAGFAVSYAFPPVGGVGVNRPSAGLLVGEDGSLYGTATRAEGGVGAVFRLPPGGAEVEVLREFDNLLSAFSPRAALVRGDDGALYGTTRGNSSAPGTIFKLRPDGSGYAVLHTFAGGPNDGAFPMVTLLSAGGGWLYGSTSAGGPGGAGTLFRIAEDGSGYAVLRGFDGSDGFAPSALTPSGDGGFLGLVAGSEHNFGYVYRFEPRNRPPEPVDEVVNVEGDTPNPLTLAATDADGDALVFTVVAPPAHGVLLGVAPDLVYAPESGYSGPDELRFIVADGQATAGPATITLNVVTPATPRPPSVTRHPASASIEVGGGAVFIVGATGSPEFQYQWRHDGEPIPGATLPYLQVLSAQGDDAGDYDVVVSNTQGEDTSEVARLRVTQTFDHWAAARGLGEYYDGFFYADAQGDPDGDGVANLHEYAFGTDPAARDALPVPTLAREEAGLTLSFRRPATVVGFVYRVEVSTDLEDWSVLPNAEVVEAQAGGVVTLRARLPESAPRIFGRVAPVPAGF